MDYVFTLNLCYLEMVTTVKGFLHKSMQVQGNFYILLVLCESLSVKTHIKRANRLFKVQQVAGHSNEQCSTILYNYNTVYT